MSIVEFNDVDISPLFSWVKEFEVVTKKAKTPVFMRVLGDADLNRARVAALRHSAEFRRKLKDVNSDERIAYIKDIDEMTEEQLVAIIIVFSMRDLSDKVKKKITIKAPKAPRSDAKTSLHEKHQQEVDQYPIKRDEEIKKLLTKEVEALKKELEKESKEALYNKYLSLMVDEMCEQELLRFFKSYCAYLGSYKDDSLTERLFSSFEEFSNLPPKLKTQFISEYANLELYGDDLKKLQQVTQ